MQPHLMQLLQLLQRLPARSAAVQLHVLQPHVL
jgi:hypothetical protein